MATKKPQVEQQARGDQRVPYLVDIANLPQQSLLLKPSDAAAWYGDAAHPQAAPVQLPA